MFVWRASYLTIPCLELQFLHKQGEANDYHINSTYLIGTLMMIVGFAIMGRGTMYAAGMTLKDVK